MKIGYSFWGFLADVKMKDGKEFSAPDGNAFYSWAIIYKLVEDGHQVFRMMPDRDVEYVSMMGKKAFALFATEERYRAYHSLINVWPNDPDLILLEWRFPIPGRNCEIDKNDPKYQPDLDIQKQILDKYVGKVPIVIFDLDYKLTYDDEKAVQPIVVLDTGHKPKQYAERVHVEIPFDFRHIDTFEPKEPVIDVVYVGNRYERDRMINQYLYPLAELGFDVHVYGNWLESYTDSDKLWPLLKFHRRISMKGFYDAYSNAAITPLLAKDEYCKYGFMTARIIEGAFFGAVPVGLSEFMGIENYLPDYLVADDVDDLCKIITAHKDFSTKQKSIALVRRMLEKKMDVSNFVKVLYELVGR